MGLQDDVVEGFELLVDIWLVQEHIEPGAFDAPLGERIEQRRFINGRSARDVDEYPFGPKRIENAGVDNPLRAFSASQGNDEEFRAPRQFDEIGDEFVRQIGARSDIEIRDAAVERGEPPGDGRADTAHAGNADPLAVDAGYQVHVAFGPAPLAHVSVRARDLP